MPTRSRRPLALLSLLATLVLAVVAGCGGGDGGGDDNARALLERSFDKQVESGDLSLKLDADFEGSEMLSGPISVSLSGPFASAGGEDVPQLDWDLAFEGQGQNLAAGVTITDDNAFVDFQGQSYEVGSELYQQFAQSFESQQADEPQSLSAFGIDPATWLEEPTVEDGEDIGGDSTQLVTGTVDVQRVAEDFAELLQSPAFRQRLESQGQQVPEPSEEDIDRLADAVEDVSFEANVDEDDYVRRIALDVDFTAPEGSDAAGGVQSGTVAIDYTLESVGDSPEIEAPADAAPIAELLQRFGLGLGGGGLGGPGAVPGLP
jgi:hypothetical protein